MGISGEKSGNSRRMISLSLGFVRLLEMGVWSRSERWTRHFDRDGPMT